MTLDELFSGHAGASFEKQLALAGLIGDMSWQYSTETGILSFENRYQFPAQLLGTHAEQDNSWLWAWGNKQSDLPKQIVAASEKVRAFGEKRGIPQFTRRSFVFKKFTGFQIAMMAVGICNADCFYRGPYDGGAAFLLMNSEQIRSRIDNSALRVINTFTELISQFEVAHKPTLLHYLRYKRFEVTEGAKELVAVSASGEKVKALFDSDNRLAKFSTVI